MRQKNGLHTSTVEKTIKDIGRATRKYHSLGEKIRIVLEDCAAKTASLRSAA